MEWQSCTVMTLPAALSLPPLHREDTVTLKTEKGRHLWRPQGTEMRTALLDTVSCLLLSFGEHTDFERNLQVISWIKYWVRYKTLVSPDLCPKPHDLMSSTSPILLPPSTKPRTIVESSFAIIPSHSWMVILLLWFWEIQVVTFEEQLTSISVHYPFSGQAVFYGLLNRIWIPHQMLRWSELQQKAPGKLPKMWPSSKTFKTELYSSQEQSRPGKAYLDFLCGVSFKMEIMISPRCVGTRRALSIWNKMKTI